jgi:PAS domain-containing protein
MPNRPAKEYSFWLRPVLHDELSAALASRNLGKDPGDKTSLSGLCAEAIKFWLRFLDPVTKLLKWPAVASAPSAFITANLPLFGESRTYKQYADEAELFQDIDTAYNTLVWASGPNLDNKRVSPLLAAFVGRTVAEFRALGWMKLLHLADQAKTMAACVQGYESRKPFHFHYRIQRPDGSYAWMLDCARPHFWPDGTFAGYIGTMYYLTGADPSSEILTYAASTASY